MTLEQRGSSAGTVAAGMGVVPVAGAAARDSRSRAAWHS